MSDSKYSKTVNLPNVRKEVFTEIRPCPNRSDQTLGYARIKIACVWMKRLSQSVVTVDASCTDQSPYMAKWTCHMLGKLDWITIPHSPYSPDIAPEYHHRFRALKKCDRRSLKDHKQFKTNLRTFPYHPAPNDKHDLSQRLEIRQLPREMAKFFRK
ncbi:hypothetical protein KIN20_024551 [Parelaphostrongylus tenuis]|uniref:Transposase n=1 Tax=Parelaphostrongylus tenuis TaxID=148309 RepID=A0AAD5QW19_PARTN|nr:hypothetical protein KIN20_024550 [Parelaphostrongylus tenuis]KAJ1364450.1 hypothetical protein KIN20_024551 [Parelaphostrongylus tenuis]